MRLIDEREGNGGVSVDNGSEYYRRLLEGDKEALAPIIREYKDGLMLYLYRFTNDINTAEELTEDTFFRLYTKRPRFSGKSSFKTWLYSIGRHIAVDYLRRHPFSRISLDECHNLKSSTDIEAAYENAERNSELAKAMQSLKAEYRQVLHLVYIEGFSMEETCSIMKKKSKQLGNLLYRAKKSLRSKLGKEVFFNEEL